MLTSPQQDVPRSFLIDVGVCIAHCHMDDMCDMCEVQLKYHSGTVWILSMQMLSQTIGSLRLC